MKTLVFCLIFFLVHQTHGRSSRFSRMEENPIDGGLMGGEPAGDEPTGGDPTGGGSTSGDGFSGAVSSAMSSRPTVFPDEDVSTLVTEKPAPISTTDFIINKAVGDAVQKYFECPTDILLVADTSADEEVLTWIKDHVDEVVQHLTLGEDADQARVGLLVYGGEDEELAIDMDDFDNPSKLRERLEDELVAASGERDGLLKDAIDYAKDTAFTEQRGDRDGIDNVVLVLATKESAKGDLQDAALEALEASSSADITFIVVGVGLEADETDDMGAIASGSNLLFSIEDVTSKDESDELLAKIVPLLCDASVRADALAVVTPGHNDCVLDVGFALDGSGSVKEDNWQVMLQFVKELAFEMEAGQEASQSRVGVATFGNNAAVKIDFNGYTNYGDFANKVDKIPFLNQNTNLAAGLREMRTNIFGDGLGKRSHIPDVGIVITDGNPTYELENTEDEAKAARDELHLFALGIGDKLNKTQLAEYADKPSDSYVMYIEDFTDLLTMVKQIEAVVCRTVATTTTSKPITGNCDNSDIAFILDASGSIGSDNWERLQDFLDDFVDKVELGTGGVQIAATSFSSDAVVDIKLSDYHSEQGLKQAMKKITFKDQRTNIADGLFKTLNGIFDEDGQRVDRPDIAILISDGHPNINTEKNLQYANDLRESGVRVFGIGVGVNASQAEMQQAASLPPHWYVMLMESYRELEQKVNDVYDRVCDGDIPDLMIEVSEESKADVIIAIDVSSNVDSQGVGDLKDLSINVVEGLSIGDDEYQVAVVSFGDGVVERHAEFGDDDLDVEDGIDEVRYEGGPADIDELLTEIEEIMEDSRAEEVRICLILTSNKFGKPLSKATKQTLTKIHSEFAVHFIVVYVGEADKDEKQDIFPMLWSPQDWSLTVLDNYNAAPPLSKFVTGLIGTLSAEIKWSCSFELDGEEDLCSLEQSDDDELDWDFGRNSTKSLRTGPEAAQHGLIYMYLEATGHNTDDDAILIFTPGISGEYCLWFNYHMFGWHTGGLMFIKESGATSNILWMVHGPQGEEWVQGFTQLVVEPSDKMYFRAVRGDGYSSDIALDNLVLRVGACPDHLGRQRRRHYVS